MKTIKIQLMALLGVVFILTSCQKEDIEPDFSESETSVSTVVDELVEHPDVIREAAISVDLSSYFPRSEIRNEFVQSACFNNGTPDDLFDDYYFLDLTYYVTLRAPYASCELIITLEHDGSTYTYIRDATVVGGVCIVRGIRLPADSRDTEVSAELSCDGTSLSFTAPAVHPCSYTESCSLTVLRDDPFRCDDKGTASNDADDKYIVYLEVLVHDAPAYSPCSIIVTNDGALVGSEPISGDGTYIFTVEVRASEGEEEIRAFLSCDTTCSDTYIIDDLSPCSCGIEQEADITSHYRSIDVAIANNDRDAFKFFYRIAGSGAPYSLGALTRASTFTVDGLNSKTRYQYHLKTSCDRGRGSYVLVDQGYFTTR